MTKYGREPRINDSTESFPLPTDQAVLFDIDGTLINKHYDITDERIYPSIQQAQEQGWTIGLSSDTPYEAMLLWKERFGVNGPIIAERGALIKHDHELSYDEDEVRVFSEARERLQQHFTDNGIIIWKGNPVEAIRDDLRIGKPGDLVVLVNTLRKSSLSFFVRTVNRESQLTIDTESTELVVTNARSFYPNFQDIDEDLNHDYGIVIASRGRNDKRLGSQRLRSAMQIGGFAMVGNSITDYIGDDIAVHYAVGDATPAFMKKSDYVAEAPLTSGAVEILGKLALHY